MISKLWENKWNICRTFKTPPERLRSVRGSPDWKPTTSQCRPMVGQTCRVTKDTASPNQTDTFRGDRNTCKRSWTPGTRAQGLGLMECASWLSVWRGGRKRQRLLLFWLRAAFRPTEDDELFNWHMTTKARGSMTKRDPPCGVGSLCFPCSSGLLLTNLRKMRLAP